jgi:hypothetical protein
MVEMTVVVVLLWMVDIHFPVALADILFLPFFQVDIHIVHYSYS